MQVWARNGDPWNYFIWFAGVARDDSDSDVDAWISADFILVRH